MSKKLLPYLWETIYKDSFAVKGGYTFEMLEERTLDIPKDKLEDSIKFCLDNKMMLDNIVSIFIAFQDLKDIGVKIKHYDRYYNKVLNFNKTVTKQLEEYQKLCTKPEDLNPIIEAVSKVEYIMPFENPSVMVYEAIRKSENIHSNKDTKQKFLKLFNMKYSNEDYKLTTMMNIKTELRNKSGLLIGTLPLFTPTK